MIKLSKYDIQWIKLIKGHYQEKYPFTGRWHNTLKPLFEKIYGWEPDKSYGDYLNVIFERLLDLHLKIKLDQSGSNIQLRNIFNAAFYKGISNDSELPIERAIHTLCGLIQFNQVIENDKPRYELNEKLIK